MKTLKKILIIIAIIIVIAICGFMLYLVTGHYQATDAAIEKFNAEGIVEDNYVKFEDDSEIGFIFYPGAKVDYQSYSYLSDLEGINVYVADFPFEIAFFQANIATKIIEENPKVKSWYIGGHSLGGTVAINYGNTSNEIKEVITLGGYPTEKLEETNQLFYPIFATEDGLIPDYKEKIELFPTETETLLIEGGNHSQYGDYGMQEGDNTATISKEEQHKIIIDAITEQVSNN